MSGDAEGVARRELTSMTTVHWPPANQPGRAASAAACGGGDASQGQRTVRLHGAPRMWSSPGPAHPVLFLPFIGCQECTSHGSRHRRTLNERVGAAGAPPLVVCGGERCFVRSSSPTTMLDFSVRRAATGLGKYPVRSANDVVAVTLRTLQG